MMLYDAERELTGFDHGKIGGALMQSWNMPDNLVQCIAHHHCPADTKAFAVDAATVHLADALVHELELGRSGESAVPPRSPEAMAALALDDEALASAEEKTLSQYQEAVRLFGLSEEE